MWIAVPVTARYLRAVLISGFISTFVTLATVAYATTPGPDATSANPAMQTAPAIRTPPPSHSQTASKPRWTDLTPAQQQALAPLASEWDGLETPRKNKWLAIGNKFSSMKPEEQQRMQERMQEWVKLTPEQRRVARQSYARAKRLDPEQKSAQWEKYQQLPEEQKKKLAEQAAAKKPVATLPSTASRSKDNKTLPPIKSAPKPVLEKSVTPQAASQSALQPSVQPIK